LLLELGMVKSDSSVRLPTSYERAIAHQTGTAVLNPRVSMRFRFRGDGSVGRGTLSFG